MRQTVLAALTASFPERSSLLPLTGAGFFPALFLVRPIAKGPPVGRAFCIVSDEA
jgi:hypothetical protein